MPKLQNLFYDDYINTRFVQTEKLTVPCTPENLISQVQEQCSSTLSFLKNDWIPACSQLLLENKESWQHLIPQRDNDTKNIHAFFESVSALMSLQLRHIVE